MRRPLRRALSDTAPELEAIIVNTGRHAGGDRFALDVTVGPMRTRAHQRGRREGLSHARCDTNGRRDADGRGGAQLAWLPQETIRSTRALRRNESTSSLQPTRAALWNRWCSAAPAWRRRSTTAVLDRWRIRRTKNAALCRNRAARRRHRAKLGAAGRRQGGVALATVRDRAADEASSHLVRASRIRGEVGARL